MEYIRAMFPKKFGIQTYISLFTGEGMSTQTGIPQNDLQFADHFDHENDHGRVHVLDGGVRV